VAGIAFVIYYFPQFPNMTLQHFNTLSQHKKHRKLLVNGVWLADRETEDSTVLLFQLDAFYVEIFFCLPHRIKLLLYNNSEELIENVFYFNHQDCFYKFFITLQIKKCRVFH